jgi:FkbM family methyltransferase
MFKLIAKKYLNSFFKRFGLMILRDSSVSIYQKIAVEYEKNFRSGNDIAFLLTIPDVDIKKVLKLAPLSKSQIRQDLFALTANDFKRNGYFVEFGATDGVSLNNTHLLETEFGWKGILVEPAKMWHNNLKLNRQAHISTSCVWSDSGKNIEFIEASIPELSTVQEYVKCDSHAGARQILKTYAVETISLNDLLAQYEAPNIVDYMSIDTEGSEYLILSTVDFSKWKFRVITVEHNFTDKREMIQDLLALNGYLRVCEEASSFDDWYLNRELVNTGRFLNA